MSADLDTNLDTPPPVVSILSRLLGLRRYFGDLRRIALGGLCLGAVLLATVWLSLPTRAALWRISHELKSRGLIVSIEDISVKPWGNVTATNVTWSFPPSRTEEISVPFVVDEVAINVSILSYLLFDEISVELDGTLSDGTFWAEFTQDGESSALKINVADLPLHMVPKIQQTMNAPLDGVFDFEADLVLEDNKFQSAKGFVDISCLRCVIGDGETKLFIPGVSTGMLAKGVMSPAIDLGTLKGRISVKDGEGVAEEFVSQSDDITVKISGGFHLKDPVGLSRLSLVIKLHVSEALQDANDNIHLLINTASTKAKMDPPDDGWLGFKLRGSIGRPKFMGIKSLSREERLRANREKRRERTRSRDQKRRERKATNAAKKAKKAKKKKEKSPKITGTAVETATETALTNAGTIPRSPPPEAGVGGQVFERPFVPETSSAEEAQAEEAGSGEDRAGTSETGHEPGPQ